jgi:hypothetical protein
VLGARMAPGACSEFYRHGRQVVRRMRTVTRVATTIGISVTLLSSTLLPSFAGSTGRKNTAIVLTAATVHQFIHKKNRNAIVLGLASAAAWKNYEDARKRESRQRHYHHYRHYHYRYGHSSPKGHAYDHSTRCR